MLKQLSSFTAATLTALILVICLSASPASAEAATNLKNSQYYIALGDSRAAGPTATSVFHYDGCGRTSHAYPVVLAERLQVSYASYACSGAVAANITDRPQLTLYGFHRPQIEELPPSTRLVTISIGGNDVQWWSLISSCFTAVYGEDAHCRSNPDVSAQIATRLQALTPSIHAMLDAVSTRAAHARIFLVGHGGYYGPRGCPDEANISPADAQFVLDFFTRLNTAIRLATANTRVRYVDVAHAAIGHDTCAPKSARWFEGNKPNDNSAARHPTVLGNRAMADLIFDAIKRG